MSTPFELLMLKVSLIIMMIILVILLIIMSAGLTFITIAIIYAKWKKLPKDMTIGQIYEKMTDPKK